MAFEKNALPKNWRWEKVGNDWVILDSSNYVRGGKAIHRGKILFDGQLVTKKRYYELCSARYHSYHGSFARDPRLQKYWTDGRNGAPAEGLWSCSNGRWREIDEPID